MHFRRSTPSALRGRASSTTTSFAKQATLPGLFVKHSILRVQAVLAQSSLTFRKTSAPRRHPIRDLTMLVFPSPATYRWSIERRSEEHTSELQSRLHLVCRLLLEKKKVVTGSVVGRVRGLRVA